MSGDLPVYTTLFRSGAIMYMFCQNRNLEGCGLISICQVIQISKNQIRCFWSNPRILFFTWDLNGLLDKTNHLDIFRLILMGRQDV